MQDVMDLLLSKGFSLQLKHEEKEVHNGFVTLFHANGEKLAHSPKMQIMFMSNREQLVASFVDECIESFQNIENCGSDALSYAGDAKSGHETDTLRV